MLCGLCVVDPTEVEPGVWRSCGYQGPPVYTDFPLCACGGVSALTPALSEGLLYLCLYFIHMETDIGRGQVSGRGSCPVSDRLRTHAGALTPVSLHSPVVLGLSPSVPPKTQCHISSLSSWEDKDPRTESPGPHVSCRMNSAVTRGARRHC